MRDAAAADVDIVARSFSTAEHHRGAQPIQLPRRRRTQAQQIAPLRRETTLGLDRLDTSPSAGSPTPRSAATALTVKVSLLSSSTISPLFVVRRSRLARHGAAVEAHVLGATVVLDHLIASIHSSGPHHVLVAQLHAHDHAVLVALGPGARRCAVHGSWWLTRHRHVHEALVLLRHRRASHGLDVHRLRTVPLRPAPT